MASKPQDTNITNTRKSALLSREEMGSLKKYVSGFPSITEAAEKLGLKRQNISYVLKNGSASPNTVSVIKHALTADCSFQ